jgi:putative acetyltransferase
MRKAGVVTIRAVTIRWERPGDHTAVRRLHTEAFGDDVVARLVDVLRVTPAPLEPRSCVAEDGGEVTGHVMLTAGRLDTRQRLLDVLVLSPLAVLPSRQGHGIGGALVARAREVAHDCGVPLLFVEGDPRFYASRGFERADALGMRSPSLRIPPASFQVARLPGWQSWMTGTLVYAAPFWALDCVGLRDPLLAELGS